MDASACSSPRLTTRSSPHFSTGWRLPTAAGISRRFGRKEARVDGTTGSCSKARWQSPSAPRTTTRRPSVCPLVEASPRSGSNVPTGPFRCCWISMVSASMPGRRRSMRRWLCSRLGLTPHPSRSRAGTSTKSRPLRCAIESVGPVIFVSMASPGDEESEVDHSTSTALLARFG